jgi:hypothetical protein
MRHLCHASSAYIVATVTQTRESATAGLQLPMAHVQQRLCAISYGVVSGGIADEGVMLSKQPYV